ncbi:NUDIX domain-containing protein [Tahibacter harae]|uniref:NUDIX hydrolase n=1 Tax=Tahibacter harae TaxID=2963937 RepID=A0ABT1QR40_9GAMM|nr:NUDIX hydrolase [Tahibacter harae]MCQ4164721.1 NUDIX hydrolase [Tahibacter harae]
MSIMQHRISAGALVEQDGCLLLVRHAVPGKYDFWVAPGGGVQGEESLEQAAAREVREETGLEVRVGPLAYIEEFHSPHTRHVKFWFLAEVLGGTLSADRAEARIEHIVETAWLARADFAGRAVFPPFLAGDYWERRAAGIAAPVRLPLRAMQFW